MVVPPSIASFLSSYDSRVQHLALGLREAVFAAAPDALEQVDGPARLLAYGYANTYKNMICVIMPLKQMVNFGFPRGVDLPDPAGLLVGTGKRARHVRITDEAQIDAPALRALLDQAVQSTPRGDAKTERLE